MLTGEVPMGRFEPPSHKVRIDVRLDEVVLRTLEREPERRYQKVSEVKSDVETVTARSEPAIEKTARRFPLRYATLWTLLFGATWWATFAFWNWRAWGVVAAGCALALVIGAALFHGRRHFPIVTEQWGRESKFRIGLRAALLAGQCMLAVALIWSATLGMTERIHWMHTYLEADSFAAGYKGEEFKLLRQLKAFATDIPKAELVTESFTWSGGLAFLGPVAPWRGNFFTRPGILLQLGIALLFLANAVNGAVSSDFFRLRVDPEWRRTIWPIAVLTGALVAGWFLSRFVVTISQVAVLGGVSSVEEVTVTTPLADVEKAISAQIKAEGFTLGEWKQWNLASVPEGRLLGKVRIANAWKASPFDRWEWRAGRLSPIAPQLALRYLSTESPLETNVRIDAGFQTRKPDRGNDVKLISRLVNAAKSAR